MLFITGKFIARLTLRRAMPYRPFIDKKLPSPDEIPFSTDGSFFVVFLSGVVFFSGGDEGVRTPDLLNAIQALSQTELRPHIVSGTILL